MGSLRFLTTITGIQRCYPLLAGATNILSANNLSWTYGGWVELVPVNTIAERFWVLGIVAFQSVANQALLGLGYGLAPNEVSFADIPLFIFEPNYAYNHYLLKVPRMFPANTRITARYAIENAVVGGETAAIKLLYTTRL